MKHHPVAALFPMLGKADLQALADDITTNGLISPIVLIDDAVLDGRNRLGACELAGVKPRFTEYKGTSPAAFVVSANLRRRHLTKEQKIALAVELEPHFAAEAKRRRGRRTDLKTKAPSSAKRRPEHQARDEAAAAVGVGVQSVSKAKAIKKADPKLFDEVVAGKKSLAKATREVRARKNKADLTKAQKTITKERKADLASVCDLRVCSCADLFASGIKPDAVITDPPYPKQFLPVFGEFAKAARDVPLVAVMVGQSYLPDVLRLLCEHMTYRWTLAYMTPGGQAVQQWQRKVNTAWKPVLLFGASTDWLGDVAASRVNDNDKRFHGWRDQEISLRHREWGYNCPAVDLDFVVAEYNHAKPVAIVEYKHIAAELPSLDSDPTLKALVALADGYRARALPCLIAVYDPAHWSFRVFPLNAAAREHYAHVNGTVLTERRFVRSLYLLRKDVLTDEDTEAIGRLNGSDQHGAAEARNDI